MGVSRTHLGAARRGQRSKPSLTWRLLWWTLGALVIVWGSFVTMAYQTGIHEADELTDGHLASVAALLLNLRSNESVNSEQATPRTAMPWLKAHDYQQSLSVTQWDAKGHMLSHTGTAPLPPFDTRDGFVELDLGSQTTQWRGFSQWDAAHERKVVVLLDLNERDDLAEDIAGQMIEPGLWLLPVVALALGFAVRRGLRPLYTLSDDVASLDAAGQQRLAARDALQEFEPVVASINTLLDRQQAVLERERRLANEVAHELRTPLSSIVLQAKALSGELSPAAQAEALGRIGQDALRAGHVLQQLLALARASRTQLDETAEPVDLAQLAREVGAEYAQAAWERDGSIGVSAPQAVVLRGNRVLLDLAVRNLVENALRHTPRGTRVEVQAGLAEDGTQWLQVCDDGGRGAAQPVGGDSLHLGHAIVARVADVHGGRFAAAPAPETFSTCYRMSLGMSGEGRSG